jgi:hypothetical protein
MAMTSATIGRHFGNSQGIAEMFRECSCRIVVHLGAASRDAAPAAFLSREKFGTVPPCGSTMA